MAARARRPLVAGNWKMHLDRSRAEGFCVQLLRELPAGGPEIVLCPPFPLLAPVAALLAGSGVEVGAQDVHPEREGAFTGDVAALQLVDAGCRWTLCGHSERRRDHAEDDELVAAKARAALAAGLAPVVCVGETRDERRAGRTFEVLARQMAPLPVDPRLVVAYEPVWAIGTGDTATPAMAAEAHAFVRGRRAEGAGSAAAAALRVLYGGSVTPDNAAALAAETEIDGFLVGGASLDAVRFLAILRVFAP